MSFRTYFYIYLSFSRVEKCRTKHSLFPVIGYGGCRIGPLRNSTWAYYAFRPTSQVLCPKHCRVSYCGIRRALVLGAVTGIAIAGFTHFRYPSRPLGQTGPSARRCLPRQREQIKEQCREVKLTAVRADVIGCRHSTVSYLPCVLPSTHYLNL